MMKKIFGVVLCLALILSMATTTYAAVTFKNFKLIFAGKKVYTSVVTDSTSKAMAVGTNSRLYLTANTSNVNCVWMAFNLTKNKECSIEEYAKLTGSSYKGITYTVAAANNNKINLLGRPDSSVSSCSVTGQFGAG